MIDLKINSNDLAIAIAALRSRASNLEPAFKDVARTLVSRTKLGFRNSSDPYGQRWARLKYRDGQPLVDTGVLSRSIQAATSPNELEIGTNRTVEHKGKTYSLAAIHQFGATILGRYRIPARPMFPSADRGLPTGWESVLAKAIQRHIAETFR